MKLKYLISGIVVICVLATTFFTLATTGIFRWDNDKKAVLGWNGDIYASVNGEPIYKSQIDFATTNTNIQKEDAYRSILKVKLLVQEAMKQNITVSEEEILKTREAVFRSPEKMEAETDEKRIEDRNKYYEFVSKMGMTYREFYDSVLKEQARTMVLSQKLSDKLADEQNIPKTDTKKINEMMESYLKTLEEKAIIVKS